MLIHYVSGSRADFGLMKLCLQRVAATPGLQLGIVATGQHVVAQYGDTLRDIQNSGLEVVAEVPVKLSGHSGYEMGLALADELAGFLKLWQEKRPDLVLLLGDRGEMLAGALAAMHLGIHIAHIGGGELTGTLDESFRHAITKLSHFHLPCTQASGERIRRMGEAAETVQVIGAPGLVGLTDRPRPDAPALRQKLGLTAAKPLALCLFHPVVQEAGQAADQVRHLVEATTASGYALALLRPNSDAGAEGIDRYLDTLRPGDDLRLFTHFDRDTFLDVMEVADLMIGNSSSGIIESASFATPCVNLGTRQDNRERNSNTFDCRDITPEGITAAIGAARGWTKTRSNIYGDGATDEKLAAFLKDLRLTPDQLSKRMTY